MLMNTDLDIDSDGSFGLPRVQALEIQPSTLSAKDSRLSIHLSTTTYLSCLLPFFLAR